MSTSKDKTGVYFPGQSRYPLKLFSLSVPCFVFSDGAAGQAPAEAAGGGAQGPHLQPDGPMSRPHRGGRSRTCPAVGAAYFSDTTMTAEAP